MNYVKFYKLETKIIIPKNYDVHHIDWNRDNNFITNLIHIPKKIHTLIHNYYGYVTKLECIKLTDIYEDINNPKRFTTQALKFKLQKHILKKKCKLSKLCYAKIQHKQITYSNNFRL